jgi:hypothetical protein
MKAQLSYLVIFFIFFIFLLGLFIASFFINKILPQNTQAYATANTLYNTFDAFIDNSFILIFFVVLIFDVIASYLNPSKTLGILNILLLFGVVYIVLFTQNFLTTLNNVLSANSILSNSYAFLISPYMPFIVFMFLIASIVLNFRHKEVESEVYEE